MSRYELLDEIDLPFPLGGCFGYWGYDLKNALEPRLPRRAVNDLGAPDAVLNFWHFCARFEAIGFRRVVSGAGATAALGASGAVSSLGYVFHEKWADEHPNAAQGFFRASRQAVTSL